jgi:hypothetical protein
MVDMLRTPIRHQVMLAAFLAPLLAAWPLHAQNPPSPEAVDAIVGSEVHEKQARAAAEPEKVISAIEKTAESAATVRKISKLDEVDIVFLTDAAMTEGGPPPAVEAKLQQHREELKQLRNEIEGNAMLYHAVDSRQILVKDILAVEFDHANRVVIYAAAKPAAKR